MSKRKLLNQEELDKTDRLNELLAKIRNAIDEIDGEINKLAVSRFFSFLFNIYFFPFSNDGAQSNRMKT